MAHMAVPGFFMLSGFVLAYNYAHRFQRLRRPEVLRFWFLRLARIYPVHLATLLGLAVIVWGNRFRGNPLNLDYGDYAFVDFVRNLLLVQIWTPRGELTWNFVSWSISSEWFAYLLFPFAAYCILQRLTTPLRSGTFSLLAIACSIIFAIWGNQSPFFLLLIVIPTSLAGAAAYCFVHASTSCNPVKVPRFLPELFVVAALAGCLLLPVAWMMALIYCSFLGAIVSLAFLGESCLLPWKLRMSVFLGEVSYSLYMTHTIVQRFLQRFLPAESFASADLQRRIGVLLIYAASVAIGCLITYFLVERPSRRWFQAWASRRRMQTS